MIVQKFGGSSLRDTEHLFAVARRILESREQGHQLVVVVSAQDKCTDNLVEKAAELTKSANEREMDVLLSTGEQLSVSLLALALQEMGCPAISLCGWQLPIVTDSVHQNARIKRIDPRRIYGLLDQGFVIIVAGFQGVDELGDITTLGRGGSDTTAVALAAALGAGLCQIFTDVEGVYTADPRIVESAEKWPEISYNDMLVMASMGAKVLHERSVELAKSEQVPLEVLSSMTAASGTVVNATKESLPNLRGITIQRENLRYHLTGISLEEAGRLMLELYRREIHPDLTEQPNSNELVFSIHKCDQKTVEKTLKQQQISAEAESWAKLSIVGTKLHSIPNLKRELLHTLKSVDIDFKESWLGERRFSVLIPLQHAEEAMRLLHSFVLKYREE